MRALGGWGKHKELPRTPPKPQSEHEATPSRHRERSERPVRGACEVLAKCERTTELPQNAETGAPRADANDGEKAGVKLAKMLNYTYKPFWRSEAAAAKPKISFLSIVPLCGGGCGGSR